MYEVCPLSAVRHSGLYCTELSFNTRFIGLVYWALGLGKNLHKTLFGLTACCGFESCSWRPSLPLSCQSSLHLSKKEKPNRSLWKKKLFDIPLLLYCDHYHRYCLWQNRFPRLALCGAVSAQCCVLPLWLQLYRSLHGIKQGEETGAGNWKEGSCWAYCYFLWTCRSYVDYSPDVCFV